MIYEKTVFHLNPSDITLSTILSCIFVTFASIRFIDPAIPADWDRFTVRYDRGTALFEIEVLNPDMVNRGVASVEMDEKTLDNGIVPLTPDRPGEEAKVKHKVKVVMTL